MSIKWSKEYYEAEPAVQSQALRFWYLGRLEEHAHWMRNTMSHARDAGVDVTKIKQAYSLVCEVIRETRSKATGRSEEAIASAFMDKLREYYGRPPSDQDRGAGP